MTTNVSKKKTDEKALAITLSGGGFRATLFHLGVFLHLKNSGRLMEIDRVVAVSGGSILAGHLFVNWNEFIKRNRIVDVASELIQFLRTSPRDNVFVAWLWSFILPWRWTRKWRRSAILEREYQNLFGDAKIGGIDRDNLPEFIFVCSDSVRVERVLISTQSIRRVSIGQKKDIKEKEVVRTDGFPVSLAVASSSCFPPVFDRFVLSHKQIGLRFEEFKDVLHLNDGGVTGNLGIAAFLSTDSIEDLNLLVCDGGKALVDKPKRRSGGPDLDALQRTLDATWEDTVKAAGLGPPLKIVLSTRNDDDWALPFEIQTDLAGFRTDLDAPSWEECYALMRAGADSAVSAFAEGESAASKNEKLIQDVLKAAGCEETPIELEGKEFNSCGKRGYRRILLHATFLIATLMLCIPIACAAVFLGPGVFANQDLISNQNLVSNQDLFSDQDLSSNEKLSEKEANANTASYDRKKVLVSIASDFDRLATDEKVLARYFYLPTGPQNKPRESKRILDATLNMVSRNHVIAESHVVEGTPYAVRIQLDQLGWTPATWRLCINDYPYGIQSGILGGMQTATQELVVAVRSDWLTSKILNTEKYYQLASLPLEAKTFYKRFSYAKPKSRLAGILESEVTHNNRVVERSGSTASPFWLVHDFSSESKQHRHNILTHPLNTGEMQHKPSLTLAIFPLPNGFPGFYAHDDAGLRSQTVPRDIFKDSDLSIPALCISCHSAGLQPFINDFKQGTWPEFSEFTNEQLDEIKSTYLALEEQKHLFTADQSKLEHLHAIPSSYEYSKDVDLTMVAAELGFEPNSCRDRLIRIQNEYISGDIESIISGSKIRRSRFEEIFPMLVEGLNIGEPIVPKDVGVEEVFYFLIQPIENGSGPELDMLISGPLHAKDITVRVFIIGASESKLLVPTPYENTEDRQILHVGNDLFEKEQLGQVELIVSASFDGKLQDYLVRFIPKSNAAIERENSGDAEYNE